MGRRGTSFCLTRERALARGFDCTRLGLALATALGLAVAAGLGLARFESLDLAWADVLDLVRGEGLDFARLAGLDLARGAGFALAPALAADLGLRLGVGLDLGAAGAAPALDRTSRFFVSDFNDLRVANPVLPESSLPLAFVLGYIPNSACVPAPR